LVCSEMGKNANSNLEPSKGGIGNKLKIINKILIWMKKNKTIKIKEEELTPITKNNLIKIPANKAKRKFDKGPAAPTKAGPYFWFFKL